jgi:large repetitive protein
VGLFSVSRSGRIRFAVGVVVVLAGIAVPGASAGDFEGDDGPCRETPGEAALLRCPTGYVGVPYEVTIATDPESGCFPYIRIQIVNSALPAGLSMTQDGVISGTPTETGLTRFWLWHHDVTAAEGGPSWCVNDDVSQREFSIQIDPGFAIVDTAAKPGTVGQPYSQKLTARRFVSLNAPTTGSDAAATWSVQSGALPPGVALSAEGLLAGTPTAEGSYQFVAQAELANGGPPATHTYTLSVRQPIAAQSTPGSQERPTGEVGIRLEKTFTAAGGTGTYTWSVSSGALPAGVALDAARGTISGAPLRAGSYQFVLRATDSEGRVGSTTAAMRVVPKLMIGTPRLKVATVARAYRARLAARGGVQPLKWRVVRGKLPRGMALSQTLGTLTGTPRGTGSFRVTVEARDAVGAKSQKALVLRVVS